MKVRIKRILICLGLIISIMIPALTAFAISLSAAAQACLSNRSSIVSSLGSGAAMANYYSNMSRTSATTTVSNGYRTTTYTSGGQSYQRTTKIGGGGGGGGGGDSSRRGSPATAPQSGTVVGTFADMGGGGDEPECYDYTEEIYAPDYTITQVVPLVIKQHQQALIAVNILNKGRLTGTTDVVVTIGTQKVTMSNVTIPAGNHALSFGYFTSKTTGTPKVSVTVNPSHPSQEAPYTTTCNTCGGCGYTYQEGAEYSYSDNEWKRTDR